MSRALPLLTPPLKGSLLCLVQAVLWSFLPVLAAQSFRDVAPLFSLTVMTSCAAILLTGAMSVQHRWRELRVTESYRYIAGNTLFNGVLYYSLVFWGTSMTSPGNASVILLMEVFFATILLGGSGFDKLTGRDLVGGALMLSGALVILVPGMISLQRGDLVVLLAALVPVAGNYCSKQARRKVSSVTILFVRSTIASILFWIAVLATDTLPSYEAFQRALVPLLFNGFLVAGVGRILWIEAIHLIPISRANSISSIVPLFTLWESYVLLDHVPTPWQIISIAPMAVGLNLLMRPDRPPLASERSAIVP